MQACPLTDCNVRDDEDKIGGDSGTEDPKPRQQNTRQHCHDQRPHHEATRSTKSNTHTSGRYASLVNAACSPDHCPEARAHEGGALVRPSREFDSARRRMIVLS